MTTRPRKTAEGEKQVYKMFDDVDLQGMLIYIVDDDLNNLTLVSAVLGQCNYNRLVEVSSGERLMQLVDQQVPDLILLDIMMPGISGFDVLELLRAKPATQFIPIIMLTAANLYDKNMESLRKSFELGACDYINKPFTRVELEMRVKAALRMEKHRQMLKAALVKIHTLEKLLPICSYCKKVRNDDDYWQEVEVYISEHTDTMFSHSICPSCYEVHVRPQLDSLRSTRNKDS